MNKLIKMFLVVMLLLWATTSSALDRAHVLKTDSLGVVYVNTGRIFKLYLEQARELLKPENADELEKIEVQLRQYFPGKFSFVGFFKQLTSFADTALFLPDGDCWFSLDEELQPALSIAAKIKPQKFVAFIQERLGKTGLKPTKNSEEFVEFNIPTPSFNLVLAVTTKGIELSVGSDKAKEDLARWKSLLADAADKNTLIAAEIDVTRIKKWLSEKAQSGKKSESFACLSRFKMLSTALQMYRASKGKNMEKLDQSLLKAEGFLAETQYCPQAGIYSVNAEKELVCSIHGTVKKPVWSDKIPRVAASNDLKPFDNVRILVNTSDAEVRARINDKKLLEQWLAIGKQQLQTVRQMAENQMGQLPPEAREKGRKLVESIKITAEGNWFKVSIEGLDEKTMTSGITGITGAATSIIAPYFSKLREKLRWQMGARSQKKPNATFGNDKTADECVRVRKSLYKVLESLLIEEDNLPETFALEFLKEKGYLQSIPDCPAGGKYELKRNGQDFEIKCSVHDQD